MAENLRRGFPKAHLDQIFANAFRPKLVAAGLDAHRLVRRGKPEAPGDAVDDNSDILVFELKHLSTVNTDEMIVIG